MEIVVLNCDDQDMRDIWHHLFTRQKGMIIKDNCGYIKIDIDTMKDLSFLSCVLKCKFVFTPQDFEYNNKKYPTIKIIRGDETNGCTEHNSYCWNRILTKK